MTEVSWAKEPGIDLGTLYSESPLSGESIRHERRISKKAAEYWAHERFLAQLTKNAEDRIADTQPEPVKSPSKGTKVRKYDFTDKQLQIALRSLDARGSV